MTEMPGMDYMLLKTVEHLRTRIRELEAENQRLRDLTDAQWRLIDPDYDPTVRPS